MNGFLVENSWKNKSTKLLVSFHLSSHIFKYLFGKGIDKTEYALIVPKRIQLLLVAINLKLRVEQRLKSISNFLSTLFGRILLLAYDMPG